MLAEDLLAIIRSDLSDENYDHWGRDELIGYLNDGQRMVVSVRPDEGAVNEVIQLAVGTPKQSIPTTALRFLKLYANMGSDGTTRGRGIRFADLHDFNERNPDWMTKTASTTILRYLHDPQDRTTFWVYPPPHASTAVYVEGLWVAPPTDIDSAGSYNQNTSTVNISDLFSPMLVDYALYRANAKITNVASYQRAMAHLSFVMGALGMKAEKDTLAEQAIRDQTFPQNRPNPAAIGH